MAVRINRVYTRTGDDGSTGLVGGARLRKDNPRIAAYGDVDELNSILGTARAVLAQNDYAGLAPARRLDQILAFVQQELFDLGSELATPAEAEYEGMLRVTEDHVGRLETFIDEMQGDLQPLQSFILPGGGMAAALLHQARTVCRRAERTVVALVADGLTDPFTARYLNRLSDLLFVQSRWIAQAAGETETLWQNGLEAPLRKSRGKGRAKAGAADQPATSPSTSEKKP